MKELKQMKSKAVVQLSIDNNESYQERIDKLNEIEISERKKKKLVIKAKQGEGITKTLERYLYEFGDSNDTIRKRLDLEHNKGKVIRYTSHIKKGWEKYLNDLNKFNWRLFGTFTTQGGLTNKQINKHVNKWFEVLVNNYNDKRQARNLEPLQSKDLKIFWVAEPNTDMRYHHQRDMFHIHMLIDCNDDIFIDTYNGMKYREFNQFDVSWQIIQGRKPYIMKCDSDGLQYKHELSKFRVQILPLQPPPNAMPLDKDTRVWSKNRVKYVAKYVAKDMIQFGMLKPEEVKKTLNYKGMWHDSSSYQYEFVYTQSADAVKK